MSVELRRAILFVKDMDRMAAFYGKTLGLERIPEGGGAEWLEYDAGGARLALHAIPAEIASGIVVSDPPRRRSEAPIKLVFSVGDLVAERQRLVACGVSMSEVQPWGGCDGIDPEGNVFQLVGGR